MRVKKALPGMLNLPQGALQKRTDSTAMRKACVLVIELSAGGAIIRSALLFPLFLRVTNDGGAPPLFANLISKESMSRSGEIADTLTIAVSPRLTISLLPPPGNGAFKSSRLI